MLARRAVVRWPIRIGSRHLQSRWSNSSLLQVPEARSISTSNAGLLRLRRGSQATALGRVRWYSTFDQDKKVDIDSDNANLEDNLAGTEGISSTPEEALTDEVDRQIELDEGASSLELNSSESVLEVPEALSYRDPTYPVPTGPIVEHLPLPESTNKNEVPTGVPEFCPGCGAKSHSDDSNEPGFYGAEANMPRPKLPWKDSNLKWPRKMEAQKIYMDALANMSEDIKEVMRASNMRPPPEEDPEEEDDRKAKQPRRPSRRQKNPYEEEDDFLPFENVPHHLSPESESWINALEPEEELSQEPEIGTREHSKILCSRCRSLLHYQKKISDIPDATFAQAAEIIAKSPFNRVHVYHLVDAADFPMSILPNARKAILQGLKEHKGGRKKDLTISYVITRADLLMPTENKVSSLMTYIRRVMSNYLGDDSGLKDLRVVSAKRTWTTERLKDEIRARKGGVVLLGKTNVGKSRLYDAIFPRRNAKDFKPKGGDFGKGDLEDLPTVEPAEEDWYVQNGQRVKYPEMPLASKIPGTTVGPITIDFAAGRGQLVDLPGFSRGGLLSYVKQSQLKSTVLINRVNPSRFIVKPGRAFMLSGLIKVKAVGREEREKGAETEQREEGQEMEEREENGERERGRPITLEVATFTSLPGHVAREDKIDAVMNHGPGSAPKGSGLAGGIWAKPDIGESFRSAGIFELTDDITKKRTIPLIDKIGEDAYKKGLAFKVWATDIVVEGFGWLEISAQVGRDDPPPKIEIWSPMGESIMQRETMGAYEANQKLGSTASPGSRPRKSMKGAKRTEKKELRKLKKQIGNEQ
ncbi:hypothetical protein ABW20_dc0107003 [Dactylellina cionopaga]|nr:hypothetical protein ABW20_dc0107003 [Dactylellina cionopaga]